MLQTDYTRGTKDSDILETTQVTDEIKAQLCALAGFGTALHRQHRIYVDIVPTGLPFLPQVPRCHQLSTINTTLNNFELEVLDIVDVVVSKLKRFTANDVSDIEAMVLRDLVPHEALVNRFKSAVDYYEMDARAQELPRYIENLHSVERDLFDMPETDIDVPAWL